jgi:hypothetical protein
MGGNEPKKIAPVWVGLIPIAFMIVSLFVGIFAWSWIRILRFWRVRSSRRSCKGLTERSVTHPVLRTYRFDRN